MVWIGSVINGVLFFLDNADFVSGFGISMTLACTALSWKPPYLGLLSFVARENSELKLFLDDIDGIGLCCCLFGDALSSRTFRDPGADLLRRLNASMATEGNR